jgi:hypothetical protein
MYIAEAKHSAGLSKTCPELLEIVENIAEAIDESQKLSTNPSKR